MPKTFFVIESDFENATAIVTVLDSMNVTNTKLNTTVEEISLNTITKTTPIAITNATKQMAATESVKTVTSINNTINNIESSYLFQSDN